VCFVPFVVNRNTKLAIFDCDSTLSAIEGIDELARVRGPQVFAEVEAMTNAAMEGKIAVEDVFARRLAIIQPRRADVVAVGLQYVERVEPTALATIQQLKAAGWTPIILSGGFRQVIEPLAAHLGIARVEAVDLRFDAGGQYLGFDESYPTTRSGGKPERIVELKRELAATRTVMVGDGASDLEARDEVDLFVGFGRYTERAKVKAGAHAFIHSLADLPPLLK
jgi:phosphoserine phosphatase